MSYAKKNPHSDVHLFPSTGVIICGKCKLVNPVDIEDGNAVFQTYSGAINHLKMHESSSHKVPFGAFTQLQSEMRAFGNRYKGVPNGEAN